MILILCFVIFCIMGVLAIKGSDFFDRKGSLGEGIQIICAIFGLFGIPISVSLIGLYYIPAHSTYWNNIKKMELEAQRNSIVFALKQDTDNALTLSTAIAEYDNDIRLHKTYLETFWVKDLVYKCYGEMETILDEEGNLNIE